MRPFVRANAPCPFCGQPTSRYGPREGQVPHDRCPTHGAVRTTIAPKEALPA